MTARMTSPRGTAQLSVPWLHVVVAALAVASAVELAILRTFTRTAIHIPAIEVLQGPTAMVGAGGEYAYFVTLGLVAPAFAVLAWGNLRSQSPGRLLAVYGLVIFAAAIAANAVRPSSAVTGIATIVAVVAVAAAIALNDQRMRTMVPVACFAVAFVAGGAYVVLPALQEDGFAFGQSGWMLNGVEWSGLAFAVTTPLIAGQRPWGVVKWIALATFALVLLAFLGNGSSTRFLLLWNVGLSGTLPAFAYAAAAGALAVAIGGLIASGRWMMAAGLVLLVTGGIGLHSTYQSALVLLGLATLCYASRGVAGAWPGSVPTSQPWPADEPAMP